MIMEVKSRVTEVKTMVMEVKNSRIVLTWKNWIEQIIEEDNGVEIKGYRSDNGSGSDKNLD